MDLGEILSGVATLFQVHTAIAGAIVAGLALLFYFRPKPMLKLAATLLVFVCVAYIFSLFGDMTTTGFTQKVKMVNDTPESAAAAGTEAGR